MPINYFLWLITIIIGITFIFVKSEFIIESIIFSSIFFLFSYIIMSRYAGKIILYEKSIEVKYYFPLLYSKKISIENDLTVEYRLSYFYYLNPDHRAVVGPGQIFRPYETILFFSGKEKKLYETLKVFTSFRSFRIMKIYLYDQSK
jgi:hypothetical protein